MKLFEKVMNILNFELIFLLLISFLKNVNFIFTLWHTFFMEDFKKRNLYNDIYFYVICYMLCTYIYINICICVSLILNVCTSVGRKFRGVIVKVFFVKARVKKLCVSRNSAIVKTRVSCKRIEWQFAKFKQSIENFFNECFLKRKFFLKIKKSFRKVKIFPNWFSKSQNIS